MKRTHKSSSPLNYEKGTCSTSLWLLTIYKLHLCICHPSGSTPTISLPERSIALRVLLDFHVVIIQSMSRTRQKKLCARVCCLQSASAGMSIQRFMRKQHTLLYEQARTVLVNLLRRMKGSDGGPRTCSHSRSLYREEMCTTVLVRVWPRCVLLVLILNRQVSLVQPSSKSTVRVETQSPRHATELSWPSTYVVISVHRLLFKVSRRMVGLV